MQHRTLSDTDLMLSSHVMQGLDESQLREVSKRLFTAARLLTDTSADDSLPGTLNTASMTRIANTVMHLIRKYGLSPGASVLSIGCGTGVLANFLPIVLPGLASFGFDRNEKKLETAENLLIKAQSISEAPHPCANLESAEMGVSLPCLYPKSLEQMFAWFGTDLMKNFSFLVFMQKGWSAEDIDAVGQALIPTRHPLFICIIRSPSKQSEAKFANWPRMQHIHEDNVGPEGRDKRRLKAYWYLLQLTSTRITY